MSTRTIIFLQFIPVFFLTILPSFGGQSRVHGWPEEVIEIKYESSADSSQQPALFYAPEREKPLPLLVGLHTWSGNYKQTTGTYGAPYAKWCIEHGWVFIHPDFRGPNNRPESTGSELVIQDILSAVAYAKKHAEVDPNRIYLVGVSGGGYTALLVAGRAPDLWAGVSAWVPITDLSSWYSECAKRGLKYAKDLVHACGGKPKESPEVDLQYKMRSPLTFLKRATHVPIDINAGIEDGHTGSVPIHHSLRAFNLLASPKDRLSEEEIGVMVRGGEVPDHLSREISDGAYGDKKPLFRRRSNHVRITLFEGGHEIIPQAALGWLAKQRKARENGSDH